MRYILIILLLTSCSVDKPLATQEDVKKVQDCINIWGGDVVLDQFGRYEECVNIN